MEHIMFTLKIAGRIVAQIADETLAREMAQALNAQIEESLC